MIGCLHVASKGGQVSNCCGCEGYSGQNGVGNLMGQRRCF